MNLGKLSGNTKDPKAVWKTWKTIKSTADGVADTQIEVLVRPIPIEVYARMEGKYLGEKNELYFNDDERYMRLDSEGGRLFQLARAKYGLMDIRTFRQGEKVGDGHGKVTVTLDDVEAVALFKGEFPDAEIGSEVALTGHLSDDVKDLVLRDDSLRAFVVKTSKELNSLTAGAEEGKGKTS